MKKRTPKTKEEIAKYPRATPKKIDTGKILLFRKVAYNPKQPVLGGTAVTECPHCKAETEWEIALWEKTSARSGSNFVSGLIHEKTEETKDKEARIEGKRQYLKSLLPPEQQVPDEPF